MIVLGAIETVIELGDIEHSIEIEAPVEDIFDFTGDWRNLPQYFPGIYEWQPTTHMTEGEGARFSYKTRQLGVEFYIETEIITVVLNQERTFRTISGADIKAQWLFESMNGRTKTTYVLDYDVPVPIVGKIIDALLVRPKQEERVKEMLENLKMLIED